MSVQVVLLTLIVPISLVKLIVQEVYAVPVRQMLNVPPQQLQDAYRMTVLVVPVTQIALTFPERITVLEASVMSVRLIFIVLQKLPQNVPQIPALVV